MDKAIVSQRPCPDALVNVFSNMDQLSDTLNLAATDKYHYDVFYNAIINNNITLNPFLFTKQNYQLCTKMLVSCANMYHDAAINKNGIEKKRYKERFHSLWRYSRQSRNDELSNVIGDIYFTRSPDLAKQLKISLYGGICVNEYILEKALSVYLDKKELDILQSLIKHNPEKSHFINEVYKRLGINAAKKLIEGGIDLNAYHYDNIPVGQSLIVPAYDKGDREMIKFLLDKGVRNTIDFKRSLQHGGILNLFSNPNPIKYLDIIQLLLERDYFNQETKNQLLAKIIDRQEQKTLYNLLLEYGAEKSSLPIVDLCLMGYIDELKLLVEKDGNFMKNLNKRSRCWCFIRALDNLEILQLLSVQQGVNEYFYHEIGGSLLNYALIKKKFDAARIFLQHGADINDRQIEQQYSDDNWPQETVDFLLKNGFDTRELKKKKIKKLVKKLQHIIISGAICATIIASAWILMAFQQLGMVQR